MNALYKHDFKKELDEWMYFIIAIFEGELPGMKIKWCSYAAKLISRSRVLIIKAAIVPPRPPGHNQTHR